MESWNERYKSGKYETGGPHRLLVDTAGRLRPGTALDAACGAGRHAVFLAEKGWRVTAVDNSEAAIEIARKKAFEKNVRVDFRLADLEKGEFVIEEGKYDLICDFFYLERSLFPKMKAGLKPGGTILAAVHLFDESRPDARFVLKSGELRRIFEDFEILHYRETVSNCRPADRRQRSVAEIAARRPAYLK